MKRKLLVVLVFLLTLFIPNLSAARQLTPSDINVPDGYSIEAAVTDLAAPTMVTFDDQGRMLIAESGYGDTGAKITRLEKNGDRTVLLTGDKLGDELPITAVAFFEGKVYVVHGGTVSVVAEDGSITDIVSGLPHGDHQANQLVFKDGQAYLGVGTVTNSGVVGADNAVFGWLKNPANATVRDVPCADLELTDKTFETENVAANNPDQKVSTSPYAAFGTTATTAKGDTKCNGSILRFNPDGSNLEVFAWGLRNPYGLEVGPDKELYITMHGFDARGSRPIENAWDCFYKVEQGKWYGWPDFACDVPVTDAQFRTQDKPAPDFIIKNHPSENPPKPIAKFNPHAATNGFAFAQPEWGKPTDTFIALFGDFTPATGTVSEPQGVKIVKLDMATGEISDFITNKEAGQASRHNAGGLEHPSDVTFGPDGAMYIADWGIARVSTDGLKLEENSGVIWKVTKSGTANNGLVVNSPSFIVKAVVAVLLIAATLFVGRGRSGLFDLKFGTVQGIIAGLITALVTIIISVFALQLPWHTPPRVLATTVMGESALANVLEFKLTPVLIGSVVLLLLSVILAFVFNLIVGTRSVLKLLLAAILFGLSSWALVQYFIFPYLSPLVTEKGFPPMWYAVTFANLGLMLGLIRATKSSGKD
jgi:glucose/arabinose dehydrogenase